MLFDIFVKIIFEDLRLQFRECDAEAVSRLWTTWLGAAWLDDFGQAVAANTPKR